MKIKDSILVSALPRCLCLCSDDTTRPEHRGVTFIPTDEGVHLFSAAEARQITRVVLKGVTVKTRVLIPKEFCEVLLTLVEDPDAFVNIEISDDRALVKTKRATLLGRLLEVDRSALTFRETFDYLFPTKMRKWLFPVPDFLRSAVARSVVLADGKLPYMQITIRDNRFKVVTGREWGRMTDSIELKESHALALYCSTLREHQRLRTRDRSGYEFPRPLPEKLDQ